jgi:hypothetical protein
MYSGDFHKKAFNTGSMESSYNSLTAGIKTGWHWFTAPFRWAGAGLSWLNHALSAATSIPLLQSAINVIKDEPLFAGVVDGVNSINSTLDDIGNFGENIDGMIRKGFGYGPHSGNSSHVSPSHTQHKVGRAVPSAHIPTLAVTDAPRKAPAQNIVTGPPARPIGGFGPAPVRGDRIPLLFS